MPKGAENPEKLVVQRRRYACVYKCIAEANVTFRERGEQARRCDTVFLKGKTMSYRAWHDEGSDFMLYRNDSAEAVSALERQRLGGYGHGQRAVCECDNCGEGIYPGEDYLDCDGGRFCKWCVMHSLTPEDLMDVMGYEFKEA